MNPDPAAFDPSVSAFESVPAVQGRFYRPIKKPITIRIDADVLHWLKRDGEGYQSRLNAILRDAMVHDLREHPSLQTANKTCTG